MLRRIMAVGLVLTGTLPSAGCCGHKWCSKSSSCGAPPCAVAPAAPCCPGPPPASAIPPPPGTSGYAPPVVAIPAH